MREFDAVTLTKVRDCAAYFSASFHPAITVISHSVLRDLMEVVEYDSCAKGRALNEESAAFLWQYVFYLLELMVLQ